jgi:hypothetical protein
MPLTRPNSSLVLGGIFWATITPALPLVQFRFHRERRTVDPSVPHQPPFAK